MFLLMLSFVLITTSFAIHFFKSGDHVSGIGISALTFGILSLLAVFFTIPEGNMSVNPCKMYGPMISSYATTAHGESFDSSEVKCIDR